MLEINSIIWWPVDFWHGTKLGASLLPSFVHVYGLEREWTLYRQDEKVLSFFSLTSMSETVKVNSQVAHAITSVTSTSSWRPWFEAAAQWRSSTTYSKGFAALFSALQLRSASLDAL